MAVFGGAGDPVPDDGALSGRPAHGDGAVLHVRHLHLRRGLDVYGRERRVAVYPSCAANLLAIRLTLHRHTRDITPVARRRNA